MNTFRFIGCVIAANTLMTQVKADESHNDPTETHYRVSDAASNQQDADPVKRARTATARPVNSALGTGFVEMFRNAELQPSISNAATDATSSLAVSDVSLQPASNPVPDVLRTPALQLIETIPASVSASTPLSNLANSQIAEARVLTVPVPALGLLFGIMVFVGKAFIRRRSSQKSLGLPRSS